VTNLLIKLTKSEDFTGARWFSADYTRCYDRADITVIGPNLLGTAAIPQQPKNVI
jgi:hypothetical protein